MWGHLMWLSNHLLIRTHRNCPLKYCGKITQLVPFYRFFLQIRVKLYLRSQMGFHCKHLINKPHLRIKRGRTLNKTRWFHKFGRVWIGSLLGYWDLLLPWLLFLHRPQLHVTWFIRARSYRYSNHLHLNDIRIILCYLMINLRNKVGIMELG